MSDPMREAVAALYHRYFTGLILTVVTRRGRDDAAELMFRTFRHQHHEKFLPGLEKLGLRGLPDAVACARYHVLSNGIGGVPVEYMEESDRKAWVRFRYPRWMYHGPTLCGIPREVGQGFMRGWYAHNGVSLGNPRLGYVCVSEDVTGEFGFCGYFQEYDHPLKDEERLRFAKGELPPPFDPAVQPSAPEADWDAVRLAKANRNYALEYVRNGLCELAGVIGEPETRELGGLAARLIGLQYFQETAAMIGAQDGDLDAAADYLATMFRGMGDTVSIRREAGGPTVWQQDVRAVRGLPDGERELVLACWSELWRGTLASQRLIKRLEVGALGDGCLWSVHAAG